MHKVVDCKRIFLTHSQLSLKCLVTLRKETFLCHLRKANEHVYVKPAQLHVAMMFIACIRSYKESIENRSHMFPFSYAQKKH